MNALVHSCVDYCNILLTGIPKCKLYKIQRVQNYAAKLVANKNRLFPSLCLLKELHWLPVLYRNRFKMLLLVYKALHNISLLFLTILFSFKKTKYELRSVRKRRRDMQMKKELPGQNDNFLKIDILTT